MAAVTTPQQRKEVPEWADLWDGLTLGKDIASDIQRVWDEWPAGDRAGLSDSCVGNVFSARTR